MDVQVKIAIWFSQTRGLCADEWGHTGIAFATRRGHKESETGNDTVRSSMFISDE